MISGFAAELDAARRGGTTLTTLLSEQGLTTLDEAYAVQRALTARRVGRGERVIGWKLGYTSAAMRRQMGIDSPNFGPLTDAMLLDPGAAVPALALQPRVEPEIALVLDRPVGPDDDVLAACRSAHACLEVVDSVWRDYRFTLLDNTADGSSAGWVVLGPELPLSGLAEVGVALAVDGEPVAHSTGAAAGGHPAVGVAWLAGRLEDDERGLRRGDVLLTGGLTAAVPLLAGRLVTATFGTGATVAVRRAAERGR